MKFDLVITSKGAVPMNYGYHEYISDLSLCPYSPDNYVEIEVSNGTVYRVHKRDINSTHIQDFLNRRIKG